MAPRLMEFLKTFSANTRLVEVLSVGDMEFQQKCLEKFREFNKLEDSIVLVSHTMGLINDSCEKTLYLLNGETRAFGPSEETTSRYVEDLKASTAQ